MSIQAEKIGDEELDRLLMEYSNAIFDCGEWTDEQEELYQTVLDRATERRVAFVAALRTRLSVG